MSLFRLDASIRGEQSVSRAVADTAEAAWVRTHPSGLVVRRDLAASPVPVDAWPAAVSAGFVPADQHTEAQVQAAALAATYADELVAAEAYLFAVPLYNYGVSQHVKSWSDLLLTDRRLAPGQESPLRGRPAALIVTRGGGYGPGTPRDGWDHATPYYRRFFGDMLGLDLHVSEVELTLAEITPAMEPLRDLARQSLEAGHTSAGKHGELLAQHALGKAA
ncbi:NAD(P)H-dependent oxidoreductase [Plantactinospora mayteni]|uniref:FMN dependent NADH:quinone oxidoreductase n=1 Tax=Plantactinospora mayteni TaxID=566021 RepID=A0ABQ4EHM7_9ACTN|nr:NAD(P)H-dependent oxidoreductase [Plantactinospora mayteni]GIG94229.1 FMN-dependent NADH-azoreductase [Plantactinospora mayteni]